MKYLTFLFLLTAFIQAQPILTLDKAKHDFGTITEGQIPTYDFVVKNTGADSLRIIQVVPSCGCTEPKWSKEAIAPNGTGVITIGYNSTGRPGAFTKSIQVISNSNPSNQELTIQGEVAPRQIVNGIVSGNLLFSANNSFLGDVKLGETLSQKFYVQNKGTRPMRITSAEWADKEHVFVSFPQRPIFAGEVVMIEVALNSTDMKAGLVKESIVLKTNDTQEASKTLTIEANIVE